MATIGDPGDVVWLSSPLAGDLPERISRATIVQFSEPLDERDYATLSEALYPKPEVTLRVFTDEINDLRFLKHFPFLRRLMLELPNVRDLSGLSELERLDHLVLGATRTKSMSLAALRHFQTLQKLQIEGHTKDIAVVAELPLLRELTLRSITLDNLDFLTSAEQLRRFELKLGGTKNLSALRHLALRYLEVWLVRGLSDLSVLAEMNALEALHLQSLKQVTELPPFGTLINLRRVYVEQMRGLRTLDNIAAAPSLEWLRVVDMPQLQVEAFRAFVGHPSLRSFSAGLGSMRRNAEAQALVGVSPA